MPQEGPRARLTGLHQRLQVTLKLFEHLLLPEVFHGILACGTAQAEAQFLILGQLQNCGLQRAGIVWRDRQTPAFHHLGHLGSRGARWRSPGDRLRAWR